MNAETLIKAMTPMPAAVWRVRARDGATGTVIDVMPDGWIAWFGDDKSCRLSKPDFLETVK